ncbi:MAG TPA: FkbM family methyltransferase [Lysobacter sp.]
MALLKKIVRNTFPLSRFIRQRDEALRNVALLQGERDEALALGQAESMRCEEFKATVAKAEAESARLTAMVAEACAESTRLAGLLEEANQVPRRALHEKPAFAHWGEDQVAAHYLKDVERGFYVDIGCYHPSLYSNTKLLFDRGWSGINVDPNPFMIQEFEKERPNDANLNLAIGAEKGSTSFMLFHDWASSNTISEEFADEIAKQHNIEIARRIETEVFPLRAILDQHANGRQIDFMNIDIESVDIEALESNDWERHRPSLIAIEDFEFVFDDPRRSKIYEFLKGQTYEMVSRCVFTSFFVDRRGANI